MVVVVVVLGLLHLPSPPCSTLSFSRYFISSWSEVQHAEVWLTIRGSAADQGDASMGVAGSGDVTTVPPALPAMLLSVFFPLLYQVMA